jgi:hypothetical protein
LSLQSIEENSVRIGGLTLLVDSAVRALPDPLLLRYQRAIVLGSLREDVSYLPVIDRVFEHLSLSHFYKPPWPGGFVPLLTPGARLAGTYHFRAAVREYRAGRTAAGFVKLGRVAHLLSDMACPVHVHRRVHDTDLYEWYVESHRRELAALPMSEIPARKTPARLIHDLAAFTARFPADRTQHRLGRALERRGLARSICKRQVAEHARAIIPVASAHMAGLFRLFLERARAG